MTGEDEIYLKIKEVLVEMFELDAGKINLDSHMYDDLDIDSIDAIDLIVELKKITGKKINPEDFKSVRTVGDVVSAVREVMDS
jgi:acyl carrier protein